MKAGERTLILLGVACGLAAWAVFGRGQDLALVERAWWTVPFSALVISVATLAMLAALPESWSNARRTFSTRSYLLVVPSFLSVNLLPALRPGIAPPAWVVDLMLVLLFPSAGLYYVTTGPDDAEASSPGHSPLPLSGPSFGEILGPCSGAALLIPEGECPEPKEPR